MPKRTSSVVGRSFGDGVRDAIQRTGMTQRALAELLDWEEAKLSDLVNGKGGVTEVEVALLLGLCGVNPQETRRLLALYRETREKGYLQFTADGELHPLRTLIEQEQLANKVIVWSLSLVSGLLQTPGYMRAVLESGKLIEAADIDAVLRTKLERQRIFHRSREFVFCIHEQALRLPVGGPDVMKAQMLHLLAMSMRPYITIRVMPTVMGAHAGVACSFVKLEYEKFEPVIFVETLRTGLWLDDKESLADYGKVLEAIDRLALDGEQSRELIYSLLP